MNFKFKAFGLAMLTVLAMSAVAASAARAQFTANSYPTSITASSALGNGSLTTEAGAMECAEHFSSTFDESSSELTVEAVYSKCSWFSFNTAMNMNGCDYVFHSNGEVDLECPSGQSIVLIAGACEVQFGSQTGLKSSGLVSNAGHIDFQFNISGITYTVTKDGFLCPYSGTGAKTGATHIHNNAVTAEPVSGGTSISVD